MQATNHCQTKQGMTLMHMHRSRREMPEVQLQPGRAHISKGSCVTSADSYFTSRMKRPGFQVASTRSAGNTSIGASPHSGPSRASRRTTARGGGGGEAGGDLGSASSAANALGGQLPAESGH